MNPLTIATNLLRRQEAERSRPYDEAVLAVASGRQVHPEELAQALSDGDSASEQFTGDVELAKRRLRWADEIEEAERAKEERRIAYEEKARIEDEQRKANHEFRQRLLAVENRCRAADSAVTRGMVANRDLRVQVPDWLKEEIGRVDGEVREARATVRLKGEALDRSKKSLEQLADAVRSRKDDERASKSYELRQESYRHMEAGFKQAQLALAPLEARVLELRELARQPWPLQRDCVKSGTAGSFST